MHSTDPNAVYIISVAARIVGMHANTLRKYERQGLIAPSRSDGNVRLFSPRDLRRLTQIKRLVEDRRVNLAGVEVALAVTDRLRALRQGFSGDLSPACDDLCHAIDEVLEAVSAVPGSGAPVDHPLEDADERTESHTRRRDPTGRDNAARPARHGPVERVRDGTPTAVGRHTRQVPDVP